MVLPSGILVSRALKSITQLIRLNLNGFAADLLRSGFFRLASLMLQKESDTLVLIALSQLLTVLFGEDTTTFLETVPPVFVGALLLTALSQENTAAAASFIPLLVALLKQAPHIIRAEYLPIFADAINKFLPHFTSQSSSASYTYYPLLLLAIEAGKRAPFLSPNPLLPHLERNGLLLLLLEPLLNMEFARADSSCFFRFLTLLALHKAIALPPSVRLCIQALETLLISDIVLFKRFGCYISLFVSEAAGLLLSSPLLSFTVTFLSSPSSRKPAVPR
jgi:hypothetical protein